MATGTKCGRPAGEVHAGEGFDEMLEKLAALSAKKHWSFTTEGHGTIDGARLTAMATEQEADGKRDSDALNAYKLVHEPVMKRTGERGAAYAAALSMARTAAKGNRDLEKILDGLKLRSGKPKRPTEPTPPA